MTRAGFSAFGIAGYRCGMQPHRTQYLRAQTLPARPDSPQDWISVLL